MFLSNSFVMEWNKFIPVDVQIRAFPSVALARSTTEQLAHKLDSVLRFTKRTCFEILTHSWK